MRNSNSGPTTTYPTLHRSHALSWEPLGKVLSMPADTLLVGVDGGGTRCRARLSTASGARLADAVTGPANIRQGFKPAMVAVMSAIEQCFDQAGLSKRDISRVTACLALAGASEPTQLALARRHKYPFAQTILVTDAQ